MVQVNVKPPGESVRVFTYLLLFVAVVIISSSSHATVINVPADQPTIQAGIDAASAGDTVLVADGTYAVNLTMHTSNVSLFSQSGTSSTILEQSNSGEPILEIYDPHATLSGFTLRNSVSRYAVYVGQNTSPTLEDCSFDNNEYGIAVDGDSTQILACDFQYALRHIEIVASGVIVDSCRFSGGSGTNGAAIRIQGDEITVTDCAFRENAGHQGSAVWIRGSNAEIQGCLFVGNTCTGEGSSIYSQYSANLMIKKNVIVQNDGDRGVYIYRCDGLTIANNTVADCVSDGYGSGFTLWDCTSSDFRNNIVVNNSGAPGLYVGGSTTVICEYNDFYLNSPSDYSGVSSGIGSVSVDPEFVVTEYHEYELTSSSPCIDAGDPSLNYNDPDGTRNDMGALFFNQGPHAENLQLTPTSNGYVKSLIPTVVWTFADSEGALQESYEIEVGTDNEWSVAEMWATGQVLSLDTAVVYDGQPLNRNAEYWLRIRVSSSLLQGGWIEMSFETYVNMQHLVPSAYPSIQSAIDASIAGDTVLVSEGVYTEHLTVLGKSVYIASVDGPSVTELRYVSPGLPLVSIGAGTGTGTALVGFTINGHIVIEDSDSILISNNRVIGIGTLLYQSPLFCTASNSLITNNVFMNNETAPYGGAIYVDADDVTISHNSIVGCESNNSGGGICAIGSGLRIEYNVLEDNISHSYGGAVYCTEVYDASIVNNTIVSNMGAGAGAGITLLSAQGVTVKNNILTGNANGYDIYCQECEYLAINYNDFFGNPYGNFYGVIPSENNLYLDPVFVGLPESEYYLSGSSPCVDAGDPADPVPEGGGDRIDMGAFEYTGLILGFSLAAPEDDSVLIANQPTLAWHLLPDDTEYGPFSYTLYLDTLESFDTYYSVYIVSDTSHTLTFPLAGKTYYWKVRGDNGNTAVFWSNETWSFRVDNLPAAPSAYYPIEGEEITNSGSLLWTMVYDDDVDDTLTYTLEIDDNSGFDSPEVTESGIVSDDDLKDAYVGIPLQELTDFANLVDNTTYYWRVMAVDKFGGESGFSDGTAHFVFNGANTEPLPPTAGFSPASDQIEINLLPEISWFPGSDPDLSDNTGTLHYDLWLDDDGEFDTTVQFQYTTNPGVASVFCTDSLEDETYWYYIVRTIDDDGAVSPWSELNTFWTNSRNDTPSVFTADYPSELSGETVYEMQPRFDWSEAIDTDPLDTVRYFFKLTSDSLFGFVHFRDSILEGHFDLDFALQYGSQYWWTLTAYDKMGNYRRSDTATFWTWTLGDVTHDHVCDIGDLTRMIGYLFIDFEPIEPSQVGDVTGDCLIDIGDLSALINHLFITFAALAVGC